MSAATTQPPIWRHPEDAERAAQQHLKAALNQLQSAQSHALAAGWGGNIRDQIADGVAQLSYLVREVS